MLTYFFYISLHYNITKNAMKKIVCILYRPHFACFHATKEKKKQSIIRQLENTSFALTTQ